MAPTTFPPLGPLPKPVTIQVVRDHPYRSKGKGKSGCAVCGKSMQHELHLGVPWSVNHYLAKGIFKYRNDKAAWEDLLIRKLELSALPKGLESVRVEAYISFRDKRTRDEGNFRYFIEKALGDALQKGGWLKSDEFYVYQFDRVHPVVDKEDWTKLIITPQLGDL